MTQEKKLKEALVCRYFSRITLAKEGFATAKAVVSYDFPIFLIAKNYI